MPPGVISRRHSASSSSSSTGCRIAVSLPESGPLLVSDMSDPVHDQVVYRPQRRARSRRSLTGTLLPGRHDHDGAAGVRAAVTADRAAHRVPDVPPGFPPDDDHVTVGRGDVGQRRAGVTLGRLDRHRHIPRHAAYRDPERLTDKLGGRIVLWPRDHVVHGIAPLAISRYRVSGQPAAPWPYLQEPCGP